MGQKIRPTSFRLGIISDWRSRWFPSKNSKFILEEDVLIRKIIGEEIASAGIDNVVIERIGNKCRITVKAGRPGLIIGKGGKGIESLIKKIEAAVRKLRAKREIKEAVSISLNIEEVKRSEISANIMAQNIAWDIEKRMPFRRIAKKNIVYIMQNKGVKGTKIKIAGRLDGGEIARTETFSKGRLPLHTIRADIDYGEATAFTTYGTVGIKVWIYKGEVFKSANNE